MRRIFLFAALAAFSLSSIAKAEVVEEFKVADWDAAAITDATTGAFSYCTIYAHYQNGSTLYISSTVDGQWIVSALNDAWTLTEGGNFAIRFKIDRHDSFDGTAVATGPSQIGLTIEADHPFIGQLRRGKLLTLSFQNEDYGFELSNSNKAMNAAQECVRRHVAAGTRSTVMSQPGTPPPSNGGSGNAEADAGASAAGGSPGAPAAESPTAETPVAEAPAEDTQTDSGATAVGEQQTFGTWVVTAANDGDGNFANCTAYNVKGDDQLIISNLPDGSWEFGFYRAAWTLDTNATYYLWYNVDAPADGAGVVKHPVEALEPTRVWFAVSEAEDIIDRIEHGTTLNLQLHSLSGTPEDYSFPLDQAPAAFAATRQCVIDHAQSATTEAPSKEGSGVKGPETQSADSNGSTDQPDTTAAAELPAMGPKKIEDLTVPGWTAAAFSQDDGTFTHCGIKAEYQNGATFGVARAIDGDMVFAVQHGDWTLSEGATVSLTYTLTGGSAVTTDGVAVGTNTIMANVGSDESLTTAIHDAKNLTLDAEGKSLAFDVSDIGPGIEAIDACVEKYRGPPAEAAPAPAAKKASTEAEPAAPAPKVQTDAAPADSTSTDTASPAPDATAPEEQASAEPSGGEEIDMRALEESFLTMGVLMKSGYFFQELPAGTTVPPELPESKTTWKLNGVIGVTAVYEGATPEEIKGTLSTEEGGRCGKPPTENVISSDNAGHMHFSLACDAGGAAKVVHYVVLPREAGGSYVLAFVGEDDGTEADTIAKKLYDTSLQG